MVAVAWGLRWVMVQWVGEFPPFVTFYPAVMLAALWCGLGPGFLATALSVVACLYAVFPRVGSFWLHAWADGVSLGFFAVVCVLLTVVADLYRRARQREATYQEQLTLREQEDRIRFALDASQMGDFDLDLIDHTGRRSPRHDQIFGYETPLRDWIYVRSLEHVVPEDRPTVEEQFRRALADGADVNFECRIRRLDQELRWIWVTGRYRHPAGKHPHVVGIIQDITDRKRVEEELRAARDSADRAKAIAELSNRTKDYFLAVLSHELRTPLTPAILGLEMLKTRPDLPPPVCDLLETIQRHIEMEVRLIDDLLDVTRIANGKIELQKQPIEVCMVIDRAVEVCQPDIQARGLEFGVDFGPERPYWVEADIARLQQVFWNLLKNAIKFTPHGGCVGIRVHLDQSQHLVVEVRDSGIGIARDALPYLFNAFAQAERAITRQFGGLGLGLAISKALVELHGGTIEAHSPGKGQGSTFRVRLPLIAPARRPASPQPAPEHRRIVRPLHILLVEDHGTTSKMIQQLLRTEGHTVEAAGDVATALTLAAQDHFDLLISDLGLPDASGYELLRELRARGRPWPAIAMSGYGQEADVQRSREAGFGTHLIKPASREALLEAIAALTASGDTGNG